MVTIVCRDVVFSNIEAIFFDKDGTLEDSRIFLQQLARERVARITKTIPNIKENLLLALGVTDSGLDPQGLMAVGSRQENELAAAAYIASSGCGWFVAKDIAREAFDRASIKVSSTYESSPLFPGSLSVLQSLVKANLKLGIISADSTLGIEKFIAKENLSSYFQVILGSDSSLSKPNPLLYLKACKILDVRPQQTLMVGDSIGDIQMADKANAGGTIGISWNNSTAKYLDIANIKITNLEEIKVLS